MSAAMLSDRDLTEAIASRKLVIEPLTVENIQPASIDLRLGDQFAAFPAENPCFPGYIDPLMPPLEQMLYKRVDGPDGRYPLPPLGFALATTVEKVTIPHDMTALVVGKSSLARCGLIVEAAGLVDASFHGEITCELFNMTQKTIMLTPGMLICQLVTFRLETPCIRGYGSRGLGSRYQGQAGPTPSRAHQKVK
jgi:dCTP deaminase